MDAIKRGREFLRATLWENRQGVESDQQKGLPPPPLQKPFPPGATVVALPAPEEPAGAGVSLVEAIRSRRSQRRFAPDPLSLEELAFLLWATQGVHEVLAGGKASRRTVPSAGARHPFETYLLVHRVTGLAPGIWRYLPLEHQVCLIKEDRGLPEKAVEACLGQAFVGQAAVVFAWTAVPYRTEWRYGVLSHKVMAIDVGHLCQNLYLACAEVGAGTCGVGAYHQGKMDALLEVDGEEEFTVYLAPVGKVA
ncbi:MAG: SagB/ThcOx family dehydrogenase [Candidatus Bipolaricaulaceae bacterium]